MESPFGKWWDDLIKHKKRTAYWIPIAKSYRTRLKANRSLKYFTLCAREMIDVFLLVKERVLQIDKHSHQIDGVFFCELDEQVMPEIKELLGYEDSGVLGRLEDILLFEDGLDTDNHTTIEGIDAYFDKEGEGIPGPLLLRLKQKRNHLVFKKQFPFDFFNLDLCDVYYQDPPNTLKIANAVKRIMQWQGRQGLSGGEAYNLERFVLAVTCRFAADEIPDEAMEKLTAVLEKNINEFPRYGKAVADDDRRRNPAAWKEADPLDFFLSAWPKELMRIAEAEQWRLENKALVHYDRVGDSGKQYKMISLICECERDASPRIHEEQSLWLLERKNHSEIRSADLTGKEGELLFGDLEEVVKIRNAQAKIKERELLPAPRRPK